MELEEKKDTGRDIDKDIDEDIDIQIQGTKRPPDISNVNLER